MVSNKPMKIGISSGLKLKSTSSWQQQRILL